MPKFLYYTFLLFLCNFCISAQKTESQQNEIKSYQTAITLYKQKQFKAAEMLFFAVVKKNNTRLFLPDCDYYIASCAIATNKTDGITLMQDFLNRNPTSHKATAAYTELAQAYFDQKNYSEAMKWFEKVDERYKSETNKGQFNFEKGYCYFAQGDTKKATTYLKRASNAAEYKSQARYYLGFMAYEANDYKSANVYFEAISKDENYSEKMAYYQADSNFKQAEFLKAIEAGKKAMTTATPTERNDLHKIIGESYFNLQQYSEAIPYLEQYKGQQGKWKNTDYYQLGYAFYKQNNFEKAISQFNKIIDGNDFVAQNAYYHLGESYLKLDKKTEALNAFKSAADKNFNLDLAEDAALNYAKLSYDIGNTYQNVAVVLLDFIQKYPNNPSIPLLEKLLVDAYVSSKNYKEALVLLEKNPTTLHEAVYQKVLFLRGVELFNDKNIAEAANLFEKAKNKSSDQFISARATFWKAETDFLQNDYNLAKTNYKQFLSTSFADKTTEFSNVYYNLGYTNFKLRDYNEAVISFQKQITLAKTNSSIVYDSYLRLGDAQFMASKYLLAMDSYTQVIEANYVEADYAMFQKSLCYGFIGKNEQKTESLNQFVKKYPNSLYHDDALYQLANTYVTLKKIEQALATYQLLYIKNPKGSFASKAILRQGLLHYNADNNDLALKNFIKVAEEFPNSSEALEAVATARLIYVDTGNVAEYASWIKKLNFVVVTDAELDNDSFESAQKQVDLNNVVQAKAAFLAYVANFPNGIHTVQANFYLAQTYFDAKEDQNAKKHYEIVVKSVKNEFTEQSLTRLSQLYIKNKEDKKAINSLLRLEAEADLYQNIIFAQSNLMQLYFDANEINLAVTYAEKVVANPKNNPAVINDAQLLLARASIENNDFIKAKDLYKKLQNNPKTAIAAEALYYDAFFKNQDAQYEASNTVIQKLAKNYSNNRYYGAKALLLMAQNFNALKDTFQASYILETILENFKEFPEIVKQASTDLNSIKSQAATTNASLNK